MWMLCLPEPQLLLFSMNEVKLNMLFEKIWRIDRLLPDPMLP